MSEAPGSAPHSSPRGFGGKKWAVALLVVALLCSTALRLALILAKDTYLQDEGASLILITGHLAEYDGVMYENHYPAQRWVRAREWKRFLRLNQPVSFSKIAEDAANSDFHPPLFYWLLYLWYRLVGVDPWTGSIFCLLLSLLTGLSLFALASEVLGDKAQASLVVLIWAVSPAVIVISEQARQYELFALATTLFAWRLIRTTNPEHQSTFRDYLFLLLITLVGALTHFHFLLVVAGGFVYSLFKLFRWHRPRLAKIWASLALGYAGLFIFHPHFYRSFLRGLDKARGFEIMERGLTKSAGFSFWEGVTRAINIFKSLVGFFLDGGAFKNLFGETGGFLYVFLFFLLLGAAMAGGVWSFVRQGTEKKERVTKKLHGEKAIIFFLLWLGGTTAVLYVSCISPRQAMGTRYLSMFWIFFAFLPLFYFRLFPRRKNLLAALFCLVLLLSGVMTAASRYVKTSEPTSLSGKDCKLLVLDSLSRTQLPGVVYLAPDETWVFAAYQDFLLAHPETWIPQLAGNVVYVSRANFEGNSMEKTKLILQLISDQTQVRSISPVGLTSFLIQVEK